jgi:hypothetical protein
LFAIEFPGEALLASAAAGPPDAAAAMPDEGAFAAEGRLAGRVVTDLRGGAHRSRLGEHKQSKYGDRRDYNLFLTHTGTRRSAANQSRKPGHFIT